MTTTQTATDQNLAATTQPGPDEDVSLFEFGTPKDVSSPARLRRYEREESGAWTAADERAFADAPLRLSGPARYSVVPCRACDLGGGELPCEECGAVANGERYD